jgi:CheY-like chemotaxis protein
MTPAPAYETYLPTLLLVEDDPDVREDLGFLLQQQGHSVVLAAHGREALDLLMQGLRPRMIILDLMMPVMDGWQLRAELLKTPELAAIPVVLLSGVADLAQQAEALNAASYLTKPIDLARLYRVVGDSPMPAR